ncbi:hypothetical protein BD769DRAFT_240005 [Suillus cothurnatus]|nr:hypothetical protein BD769DRAFT_240005 [Suillus cothurnatus]
MTNNAGNPIRRGRLIELKANGQVVFDDGTMEGNIDHCILTTRFLLLGGSLHNHTIELPSITFWRAFNSTYHVAKHLFPLQTQYYISSVAFMGRAVSTHGGSSASIVRAFRSSISILFAEAVDNDMITLADKLRRVGTSTTQGDGL